MHKYYNKSQAQLAYSWKSWSRKNSCTQVSYTKKQSTLKSYKLQYTHFLLLSIWLNYYHILKIQNKSFLQLLAFKFFTWGHDSFVFQTLTTGITFGGNYWTHYYVTVYWRTYHPQCRILIEPISQATYLAKPIFNQIWINISRSNWNVDLYAYMDYWEVTGCVRPCSWLNNCLLWLYRFCDETVRYGLD